ncbi:hypothetical protein [Magnaporthe oryzae chrysovirus 1]|uniref:Uncharacterized protein n=1 Tax=Magnaporthe oryzae chrysovirus 1-A TaxID=2847843 RepID=I7H3R3_9VIRU|nr:hypothetical protein [Magnaporthe oryzae chrysovirus 1]BAM28636.1 hypothetical protein [Magnaporthe oryzae chrysovirus 1-A]
MDAKQSGAGARVSGWWPDRQVIGREALRQRTSRTLGAMGGAVGVSDTPRSFFGGGEVPTERLRRGLPSEVAGMFTAEQLSEMLDMSAEQRVKALADAWERLAAAEASTGPTSSGPQTPARRAPRSVSDYNTTQWVAAAANDGIRVTPTLTAAARAVAPALNRAVVPGGCQPHASYGRATVATGTGDIAPPSARQTAVVQAIGESVPTEPVDAEVKEGTPSPAAPPRLLCGTATLLALPQVCCGSALDHGCAAAPCAVGQVSGAAAAVALASRPVVEPDADASSMGERWKVMSTLAARLGPIAQCHFGSCRDVCACTHRHPLARALMGIGVGTEELRGARVHLTTPQESRSVASVLLEKVGGGSRVERLAVEFVKAVDGPVLTSLVVASRDGKADNLLTLVAEAMAQGSLAAPRTMVTFGRGDGGGPAFDPNKLYDACVYSGERGHKLGVLSRAVWLESDADVHWMPHSNSLRVTLQCWNRRGDCKGVSAVIGPTTWRPHVGNSSWETLGSDVYRDWFGLVVARRGGGDTTVRHQLSYNPGMEADQLGGLLAHSGCGVYVSGADDAATVAAVHPSLQVTYTHITLGSPTASKLVQAATALDEFVRRGGAHRP